jgi:hypothetical protein
VSVLACRREACCYRGWRVYSSLYVIVWSSYLVWRNMLLLRKLKAMTNLSLCQWPKLIPGILGVGYWAVAGNHVATAQVEGNDEFTRHYTSVAKVHTWYAWCRVLVCRWEACCYCAGWRRVAWTRRHPPVPWPHTAARLRVRRAPSAARTPPEGTLAGRSVSFRNTNQLLSVNMEFCFVWIARTSHA